MNDKSGSVFLALVSLLCVAIMGLSVCLVFKDKEIIKSFRTVSEYTFDNNKEISKISNISDSNTAIDVNASGEAVGSIVEKFISPYSANTSYNNVYVKNTSSNSLDIASMLKEKQHVLFAKSKNPQILIVHTHTNECYLPEERDYYTKTDVTRSSDNNINVVAVGSLIAKKLNEAGYVTIHDQTVHDATYTGSYSRSAETIKKHLAENPSIKLVIDIHRDSISADETTRVKPVATIKGKKCAQVMLVMCCGEGIEGFDNWRDNMKFALKYQQTLEVMFPGLARAMNYLSYKYNQDLATPSILLEVGTEVNSIEEALNSAEFAADALIAHLNTLNS